MLRVTVNSEKPQPLAVFLQAVFSRMSASGAEYAILRNYRDLPGYVRHDIDMAVAPESLSRVVEAIRGAALEAGWALTGVRTGVCTTVFVEEGVGGRKLHFDLSNGPRWYCFEFVDWRRILAKSVLYRGFRVADAAGEAVVCLMLRLLYGGYVKDEYRDSIRRSASDEAIHAEMRSLLLPWLGDVATMRILGWAACGDWKALEGRVGRMRARAIWGNLKRPSLMVRHVVHDLFHAVLRWFSIRHSSAQIVNS